MHSLHAYFIRRGDADEPIRFEVDRLRNGRSFVHAPAWSPARRVGAILTMSLSFQVDEAGHDVQIARACPTSRRRTSSSGTSWSPMFERRFAAAAQRGGGPGRRLAAGCATTVGDDPVLQACALAYLSDDLPTDAVVALHPERPGAGRGRRLRAAASCRPASTTPSGSTARSVADEWHIHDFASHGYLSSRGLAVGHVFTRRRPRRHHRPGGPPPEGDDCTSVEPRRVSRPRSPYIQRRGSAMSSRRSPSGPRK